MQAVAELMEAEVPLEEIGEYIARHRRLEEMGFDELVAEPLAEALAEVGVPSEQRRIIIRRVVELARATVDREELEEACRQLQSELATLETRKARLKQAVEAFERRHEDLKQAVDATQKRLAALEAKCAGLAGDFDVLHALRAFLLRKTVPAETFWIDLESLSRWRRLGGTPDDAYAT